MHPTGPKQLAHALAALLLLGACGDDGAATTAASGSGGGGGTTPGGDGGGGASGEPSSSTGLGSSTVVTVGDASTGVGGSTSGGASGSGGDPGAGGRGDGGATGNGGSGAGGEPGAGGGAAGSGGSGQGGSGQGGGDTTGSGGGCSVEDFFSDPTCDACAIDACCAEVENCVGDIGDCLDANDVIDPDTTYGGPLLACLGASCANPCGVGSDDEICDSNIGYLDANNQPDTALNACVEATCCDDYRACTSDGADSAACVDCLEAEGGPLCDAAIDCLAESGCLGGICGSGLDSNPPDPAYEACIEGSCCVPFDACYGSATSAEVAACNACLQAGQGALCDALIDCIIDNGC